MIAFLRGKIVDKKPTEVVLDVQGVGYRMMIPTSTYEVIGTVDSVLFLHTYQYVREDTLSLYGFSSVAERSIFELLISVSGIGPRLALAALSAMRPAELQNCIMDENTGMLIRIPGVGRKTAERLIIELRDKIARIVTDGMSSPGTAKIDGSIEARADALAALETLGLSRAAGEKAIRKVLRDHPALKSADELIRLALRV